jgi:transcriptional regulator with XRE-family HTH domain
VTTIQEVPPVADAPFEHGDASFAEQVGAAVRRRRRELDMTGAELAQRTGVSASFISQLEKGQSSISIPRLYNVAEALDTTPNSLLPGSTSSLLLTRSGQGQQLSATHHAQSQTSRLLTRGGPGIALKAHHYLIEPGDPDQEWFQHHGEDFVYLIRGRLVVEFAQGPATELAVGDALHHDGYIPHRWIQLGDEPAEVVIVNDIHT